MCKDLHVCGEQGKASEDKQFPVEDLTQLIRNLLLCGYNLESIKRLPSCAILHIHKLDKLGAKVRYSILLAGDSAPQPIIKSFLKEAEIHSSSPVGIGISDPGFVASYTIEEFYKHLGGTVISGMVFDPDLPNVLHTLGHNSLPRGLDGNASDLFEEYVKECLQFLFNRPARRYGQERLFESLPDGVAIDAKGTIFQFDTKAYEEGYTIQADDIKRFASYVEDFHSKYEFWLGRVYSFIVVTSTFKDGPRSLEKRRKEFYEKCRVQLSCVKAKELGEMIQLLKGSSQYRLAIDWRRVFSNLSVEKSQIELQIKSIRKDGIIEG